MEKDLQKSAEKQVWNLVAISMDYSGDMVIGARDFFKPPNEGKDYSWYISGKKTANWVNICFLSPITIYKNLKTLLTIQLNKCCRPWIG